MNMNKLNGKTEIIINYFKGVLLQSREKRNIVAGRKVRIRTVLLFFFLRRKTGIVCSWK